MKENEKGGNTANPETHSKDTKHVADIQRVLEFFQRKPATMFMCEITTGIPRPYVCWYVRHLRKQESIKIASYGRCPVSKYDGVQFLTTNKALFPELEKKYPLFDEYEQS